MEAKLVRSWCRVPVVAVWSSSPSKSGQLSHRRWPDKDEDGEQTGRGGGSGGGVDDGGARWAAR